MTIDDKIICEKLQYDTCGAAAKISALSSAWISKCEYLTSEEILPLQQPRKIGEAKFTYSLFGKSKNKGICCRAKIKSS